MLQWINEHSEVLSILLNLGTMIVWVLYFHILYSSFMRQRRTRILINRGAGTGPGSRCLISNMGAEPLYVMSILGTLRKDGQEVTAAITDLDAQEVEDDRDMRKITNQGPLMSGEHMDIGTFSSLMARCARQAREADGGIERRYDEFDLLVIAAYGADDLSVGAERRFVLCGEAGAVALEPVGISTRQLRGRPQRRRLERLLYDYR